MAYFPKQESLKRVRGWGLTRRSHTVLSPGSLHPIWSISSNFVNLPTWFLCLQWTKWSFPKPTKTTYILCNRARCRGNKSFCSSEECSTCQMARPIGNLARLDIGHMTKKQYVTSLNESCCKYPAAQSQAKHNIALKAPNQLHFYSFPNNAWNWNPLTKAWIKQVF